MEIHECQNSKERMRIRPTLLLLSFPTNPHIFIARGNHHYQLSNATEAWLGSSDLCTVLAACFPWYPGCLLDVAFHLSPDAEGSGPVVPEILKSALISWRLGPHWQMQITGHFLEHCYTSPLAILDGSPQLYHAKLVQDRRTVGGEGLPGADGFSGE